MYYEDDGLGNVMDITDHLGNNVMSYRYDVFGNLFTQMAAPYNDLGYTGQLYDPEASLLYLSARWYSPSAGRFTTSDTYMGNMTNPQTLNLYAYTGNNPVNYTDPTGHKFYGPGGGGSDTGSGSGGSGGSSGSSGDSGSGGGTGSSTGSSTSGSGSGSSGSTGGNSSSGNHHDNHNTNTQPTSAQIDAQHEAQAQAAIGAASPAYLSDSNTVSLYGGLTTVNTSDYTHYGVSLSVPSNSFLNYITPPTWFYKDYFIANLDLPELGPVGKFVTSKLADVFNAGKGASDTGSLSYKNLQMFAKGTGEGAVELNTNQLAVLKKMNNVIENNLKPGDFSGASKEVNGISTGWDHVTEMKQSQTALNKIKTSLEGSLKNPTLKKLQETFYRIL